PRFIAQGYDNSGNGEQRDWLSETDFNRIQNIAQSLYGYDAGGQPGNGTQTQEKTLVRLDWNINDRHSASVIYNGYEGVQDRASDSDSNEFEFANHFYQKGAEITSTSVILASQWTDAFSTQVFFSRSEMDDSQITVGDKDFAEVQIRVDGNTVFLGADDSRQANELSTESTFFKLNAQYLAGDHILSAGYEQEKLDIFNLFVQHARGGEIRFNSIDDFEQGTPSRYYYGNAGGSNDANDAAASFSNTLHTVYIQDDFLVDRYNLTITAGLRYDWFTSDDRPLRNSTFEAANGLRNDENIDDLDLLMPRLGLTWDVSKQTTVRGGIGLYSGGNPNVWLSNAWSNDGITNVQRSTNYDGSQTLFSGNPNSLTSIPLSGDGAPGYNPPQNLVDGVTAIDPASGVGSDSFLVLIDPGYEQPSEWKYAIGATHTFDNGVTADIDLLYSVLEDSAIYRDLSQSVVGQTTAGKPIYAYTNGRDNFMLTNSSEDADALTLSLVLSKQFDNGLDVTFGYAYTDAEDISPMTSSVAGSNFDNLALHDINNPEAGTSNYEVPHRFTLKLSYGHDFFTGYETRITSYFTRKSGQPQSYVMGSGDLEGDSFFGRHLLYVPSGVNDPNVVFGPDFDTEAFFAWASGQGLQPGFTNRNENYAHWSSRMDVRFDQEIPSFFDDTKGRVYLKVYNFLNLLNDDWGIQYDAQFFSVQAVDSSVNDSGQYVFENFRGGSVTDVLEQASRWEARLGIEFEF
ncbi:MAG: TonB-dependent receptor, partial [Porticoccaceae bacterium]